MAVQIGFRDFLVEVDDYITYNFQTASVGDLSLARSNYTSSFNIPRTLENQEFFDGLGIPSDTSQRPYVASHVNILDEYAIVYSGTLVVLKTTREYYQCTVISGTFDFFNFLGDKTFADIDISSIVHSKTKETVRDRITNTNLDYAYFVGAFADFQNFDLGINVDAMAVGVKLQYLLDRIFAFAQMSYSLPSSLVLDNEFMTFPYPPYPEVVSGGSISFSVNKTSQGLAVQGQLNDDQYRSTYGNWSSSSGSGFTLSGFDLVCNTPGQYVISFAQCIVQAQTLSGNDPEPVVCRLVSTTNRYIIGQFTTDTINSFDGNPTFQTAYNFSPGEVMRVEFYYQTPGREVRQVLFSSIVLNMQSMSISPDGLRRIFGFGLSDFIKEIMYRYALIPFMDGNTVEFVRLEDVVQNVISIADPSNSIDWTDKYIQREEESYDIGYSQNNFLRHKYVDGGVDLYDRNIQSNNQNLSSSQTIIDSKVFAPPLETSEVIPHGLTPSDTVQSRRWITYDVTLNDDGSSATVKTENRNFFVRIESVSPAKRIRLTSSSLPGSPVEILPNRWNLGTYTAGFIDSAPWNSLRNLIINTRQHIIALHLNNDDVRKLDQTKPYYFQQENAFYVLSKLQYKKGSQAKGEFIKINYNID